LLFSRRKVRGNIISDADGQQLDQSLLHGLLGGRDRSLLERLFVLDTEALREEGRRCWSQTATVASALLSAAGGISSGPRAETTSRKAAGRTLSHTANFIAPILPGA